MAKNAYLCSRMTMTKQLLAVLLLCFPALLMGAPRCITVKAGDATVKSVQYVNALGQASDRPFNGLNIVVTTHTDGTVKTAKVVF